MFAMFVEDGIIDKTGTQVGPKAEVQIRIEAMTVITWVLIIIGGLMILYFVLGKKKTDDDYETEDEYKIEGGRYRTHCQSCMQKRPHHY